MLLFSPIRPIFIPERARALRADWAPGPGVLVLRTQTTQSVILHRITKFVKYIQTMNQTQAQTVSYHRNSVYIKNNSTGQFTTENLN